MGMKPEIDKALKHTIEILNDAKTKYKNLTKSEKDARINEQMGKLAQAAEEFNAVLSTPDACCPEWPNVCGAECPCDNGESD